MHERTNGLTNLTSEKKTSSEFHDLIRMPWKQCEVLGLNVSMTTHSYFMSIPKLMIFEFYFFLVGGFVPFWLTIIDRIWIDSNWNWRWGIRMWWMASKAHSISMSMISNFNIPHNINERKNTTCSTRFSQIKRIHDLFQDNKHLIQNFAALCHTTETNSD